MNNVMDEDFIKRSLNCEKSRTAEKCKTSQPAPKKLDFDGKICYNTFGTIVSALDISGTQALQIQQKREVLFATPSGRQTSKERQYIPCVAVK